VQAPGQSGTGAVSGGRRSTRSSLDDLVALPWTAGGMRFGRYSWTGDWALLAGVNGDVMPPVHEGAARVLVIRGRRRWLIVRRPGAARCRG
jgi:hypothetical protein